MFAVLAAVQSRAGATRCVSEDRDDNRIVGRLKYVSFQHPGRPEVIISGYELVLLQPTCFDAEIWGETGTGEMRTDIPIHQVALIPFAYSKARPSDNKFFKTKEPQDQKAELERYLRGKEGKMIVVTGSMSSGNTIYWLTWPQIAVSTIGVCRRQTNNVRAEDC